LFGCIIELDIGNDACGIDPHEDGKDGTLGECSDESLNARNKGTKKTEKERCSRRYSERRQGKAKVEEAS